MATIVTSNDPAVLVSKFQNKIDAIEDELREAYALPDSNRSKAGRLRRATAALHAAEAEFRILREELCPARRRRRKTALAPGAAIQEALYIVRSAACSTAQIDWYREPKDPFERDWRLAVIRRIEIDNAKQGAEAVCLALMGLVTLDEDEEGFAPDLSGALERWRETLREAWEQSHRAKMRPLYDAALRDVERRP